MNILQEIVELKKNELKEKSKIIPLNRIQGSQRLYSVRNFYGALRTDGIQIIAEIKRKSPALGNINVHADPSKVAKSYEVNGAACISVLTDQKYFGGQLEFIQQARSSVNLPILRKDFIISEYQIWESFHAGADAILLIADAIEKELLMDLYALSIELGLHVLIETHNIEHLQWICNLSPKIVGVNCRDLASMKTDIALFEKVVNELPKECIWIAESGINSYADLQYVHQLGFHAALIGTSLMKSKRPGLALAELLHKQ